MLLTQEQLAEAMGVTVGTVSKWENGNCVPDINTMMDLADFFNLSMDALVGYSMVSKRVDDIIEESFELYREHRLDEAREHLDKAVVRYPNDVKILKRAGSVYYISWYQDNKNEDFRNRAIELFNRALRILADSPENKIDEIAILRQLALLEKDNEKQIEIIKHINVDGIYDDLLGEIYWHQGKKEEALACYTKKFHFSVLDATDVAGHMLDYFFSNKKYKDLLELYQWVEQTVAGLMLADKPSYLTRYVAMIKTCEAICYELIGNHEKMMSEIALAIEKAKAFDADPVYDIYTNVRFVYGTKKDLPVAYDDKDGNTVLGIKQIVDEIYSTGDLGFTKKELQAIKRVQEYIAEHINN